MIYINSRDVPNVVYGDEMKREVNLTCSGGGSRGTCRRRCCGS